MIERTTMKQRSASRDDVERLQADPELRARIAQKEDRLKQQKAFWDKAEAPLVARLRLEGLVVSSVWDLVNRPNDYDHVLPILLEHLRHSYPHRVREGIARAMAVPGAASMWEPLRQLFLSEPSNTGRDGEVKWALALALAAAYTSKNKAQLLELLKDARHGHHRVAFIRRLARFPRDESLPILVALVADESTKHEASRTLARLQKRKR